MCGSVNLPFPGGWPQKYPFLGDKKYNGDVSNLLKRSSVMKKNHTRLLLLFLGCMFGSTALFSQDISTVYDLDSNNYTVIKIGKQSWLKENLRTTQYNDTTPIATGLTDSEWKQTKKGAYAVYDNNPLHEKTYGKLYNGYAVRTGKLCPKGWRIATDKDWNELEQFLGLPKAELEIGRASCRERV